MLLLFRTVLLHSTKSLDLYVKARELKSLVARRGNKKNALADLLTLMQVASRFSFAIRTPSFNDDELARLRL